MPNFRTRKNGRKYPLKESRADVYTNPPNEWEELTPEYPEIKVWSKQGDEGIAVVFNEKNKTYDVFRDTNTYAGSILLKSFKSKKSAISYAHTWMTE